MKIVILAGGFGTRLSEETEIRPKPMVEIGGKPILWHIMKIYSHYGFNDFIICLGYKGYMIKEYFANYYLHHSDLMFDLKENTIQYLKSRAEDWKITLVETGLNTMTGGRIKRIKEHVNNETFMMTYGDGVSDINIKKLVDFHKKNGKKATMSAIQIASKFGTIGLDERNFVSSFREKSKDDSVWINGGFFVLKPDVFDYIEDDQTPWEKDPLDKLSKENELIAYKHRGFWKCMDHLRDKIELEKIYSSADCPWSIWKR